MINEGQRPWRASAKAVEGDIVCPDHTTPGPASAGPPQRCLKPEDREYLDLVRRLFLADPADPAIVDAAVAPVRDEPDVPRPAGCPSYGLTQRGHVVKIPRRPGEERNDPVRSVTGPGWPAWFRIRATDPVVESRPGPRRATRRRGDSTPPRPPTEDASGTETPRDGTAALLDVE
jgi:hypothetical protein